MSSIARLQRENEELRRQLGEAEDALRAIREGQVDAIVVDGERGTQVFSLAGAERIYRVLVETMYEAALTVAPDGTILFCNQRFCDLMRTALPETVGRKLEAFTPAEERPELAALLAAARTGPAHRQFVLRADDGTVVPAQLAANLLDDGESPSVCVVASDLTELEASARSIRVLMEHQRAMEEAQAALRSSEERYRRLVETASEGIWLVDAGLRTIDVNNRMAEMLGRARDELFGRQVSEFLPPEEAPQSAKRMADRLRGHSETFELPLRRKDGSTCWTLVSASPLRDGQDRIVGSFGMFTDITERRRAEEEARRGEEERKVAEVVRGERQRLFGVLETLPAMICLLTPDHHVAFANRSFRDRFGDARGRRCFEANFNRDAPCEFCETYNVLATGQPHRWEAAVPGETVLDVFALPFTDADGSPMILEMNLDITERRRAEQQLQNAHENLAARVSQLRALAGELTLSEQRERWRLAKVLHDHLQQLLVAAKFRTAIVGRLGDDLTRQATAEIEHLLDESISSARELTSELSPPVLHQAGLPAGLEWLARWMADRHALHVNLAIEGGLPPLAEDVRILLFESVRELLFNVVKHANVASADVSVGRVAGDDIRIAVSDSGAGFDPGTLKQAGEVGSGFGLFSIRERLELLGGRMDIDSAPGAGSRFTLTAPLGPLAAAAPPPVTAMPAVARSDRRVPSSSIGAGAVVQVLIADDHAVVREGLRRLVGDEPNMRIAGEAADGQEAVDLARTLHPDVILMDVSMPNLDGIEATRAIHHDLPDIRIIGLSMFEDGGRAQAMRDAGAVEYVTKSGRPDDLVSAIRRAIKPPVKDKV